MAAVLEPAGSGVAGVQPKGITQQYQLAATNSNLNTSTGIHPYDSGTILGTVPPGKTGLKLVSGVVQRSNQLLCDATPGVVGNALVGIAGTGRAVPTPAAGTLKSDGLSGAPDRE
jgi:hypothetical protein